MGVEEGNAVAKLTLSTLKTLKTFADFDAAGEPETIGNTTQRALTPLPDPQPQAQPSVGNLGLNLAYTINLNLPATSDQAVFNAIFRSLKEHLLSYGK